VKLDSKYPRVAIGSWPTPVRRLEAASAELGTEVWAKIEEDCGAWGGNKVRKLEYIFSELERSDVKTLVTYGAGTSSWAAALVLHSIPRGYRITLGLGGVIPHAYAQLYKKTDTRVVALPGYSSSPLAAIMARLSAGLRDVRVLPPGGSGFPGDLGPLQTGLEIATAVEADELPRPEAVFVPCGTAGTAAGIAVGLGSARMNIPVVAVRVTPRPLGTPWLVKRHVRSLLHHLNRDGVASQNVSAAPIRGEHRFFPPAYGVGNSASRAAIELVRADGLDLDPTYAAKGFAAVIEAARHTAGPLLFLHTSPGPLPAPS
jgi:D-cysteine desulfhydrase